MQSTKCLSVSRTHVGALGLCRRCSAVLWPQLPGGAAETRPQWDAPGGLGRGEQRGTAAPAPLDPAQPRRARQPAREPGGGARAPPCAGSGAAGALWAAPAEPPRAGTPPGPAAPRSPRSSAGGRWVRGRAGAGTARSIFIPILTPPLPRRLRRAPPLPCGRKGRKCPQYTCCSVLQRSGKKETNSALCLQLFYYATLMKNTLEHLKKANGKELLSGINHFKLSNYPLDFFV